MQESNKLVLRKSDTLVKFDPNADKTLIKRGLIAVQSLEPVGRARYFYERGLAKYAAGEYQDAVERFRRATSLSPFFPEAHFYLGLALRSLGGAIEDIVEFYAAFRFIQWGGPNIDQAIAAFRVAVEQQDDYPEAHLQLGLTLWPFGRGENSKMAKSEIKKAVSLGPESFPEAHFILGFILCQEEKWEGMKSEFSVVMSQDPTLHWLEENPYKPCVDPIYSAQWCRASLLKILGEHEKAATEYEACLLRAEAHNEFFIISAHENLGDVYKAMNNHPKAIAEYQSAVKLAADFGRDYLAPGLRYKLGLAYVATDSFEGAIKEFQAAIRGRKDDWQEAHYNLGCALWLSDRDSEAVEEFSIALEQGCKQPYATCARQCMTDFLVTLKAVQALISLGKEKGHLSFPMIKYAMKYFALEKPWKGSFKVLITIVIDLIEQEGIRVIGDVKERQP